MHNLYVRIYAYVPGINNSLGIQKSCILYCAVLYPIMTDPRAPCKWSPILPQTIRGHTTSAVGSAPRFLSPPYVASEQDTTLSVGGRGRLCSCPWTQHPAPLQGVGQAPTSCLKLPLACLTWAQLLVTLAAFQGVFLQLPTQHTPRGLGTPLGHMAGKTGLAQKGVEAADDLRC